MGRDSREADFAPLLGIVNPIVARATEGAAPKSPAKLFGRSTFPISAKRLTTTPPIINLVMSSAIASVHLCSETAARLFDQTERRISPLASEQAVLLALQIVIVHKE